MKNDNVTKNKKFRCFWGHRWSNWTTYSQSMYNVHYGIKYNEDRQFRQCLECGKKQDEPI
jgi:hypothetical protein